MMRLTLAALAALSAAAAPASAAAWRFKVEAWELQSPGGLERTMQRIVNAAESICGMPTARTLNDYAQAKACVADVTAEIVSKIDNPQLTAMADAVIDLDTLKVGARESGCVAAAV
ncbi:MAG: UrcA family protein [Parvularculaceae bacterium]|nr:UrcA family protein [Parvularculaceae bacterium]